MLHGSSNQTVVGPINCKESLLFLSYLVILFSMQVGAGLFDPSSWLHKSIISFSSVRNGMINHTASMFLGGEATNKYLAPRKLNQRLYF